MKAQFTCLRGYRREERERRPFFFPVLTLPKCPRETLQSALGMQTMRQGSQGKFSKKVNLESVQEFNRHQSGQSMACLRNRK